MKALDERNDFEITVHSNLVLMRSRARQHRP
jgi:hypothetical protein